MLCLPLDLLPGWLFGTSTSRARPELAPKLIRYRDECFRVLWRAFQSEALSAIGSHNLDPSARSATNGSGLVQIRELGLAIAQMADQQLVIEQRVAEHHGRLERAASVIREVQRRLTLVEEQVAPTAYI